MDLLWQGQGRDPKLMQSVRGSKNEPGKARIYQVGEWEEASAERNGLRAKKGLETGQVSVQKP